MAGIGSPHSLPARSIGNIGFDIDLALPKGWAGKGNRHCLWVDVLLSRRCLGRRPSSHDASLVVDLSHDDQQGAYVTLENIHDPRVKCLRLGH